MPQISQGTQQDQRIGQQIKIHRIYVTGFVNLLPYNVSTNPLSTPLWVKIWAVSSKFTESSGFSTTPVSSFFETGNNTIGFQGNMLDMVFQVNRDAFTVHATRKYKLGGTSYHTGSSIGQSGYFDSSNMSVPFTFNLGKHFKQQLKYNDDSSALNGNYPYNRNLYIVFQAVYADGSLVTGSIAEYHYTQNIDYTDL